MNSLLYTPTHIFYMNTIQCNQRCTKCSHWKYKDQAPRLPTSILVRSLKKMPAARELCIVGGEPLLLKEEVLEILDGIADTSIRTVIVTNGVPLDPQFVAQIAGFDIHIVVSIDTMDREFWHFVRGANSYDLVFRNLETAMELLPGPKISIQSVLARETEPHLGAVSAYARKKNIHHSIQEYVAEGFEGCWTPAERGGAFEMIPSDQPCHAADRNLSILQNGDVFTCFQQSWIDGCEVPLGNLHSDDIDDLLGSEYARQVAQKMRTCNLPCKVLKCNTPH